ncbi:nitrous oxide reductase family maturation protein NosD [Pseudalkalibacillus sp. SCS-8]|uniref:right-handed parallel beta-helix repeat-containing protein n=1 Tax=Pseudalkalibacillus nanhaiensis TaxID=3115291 RepID=UPI0032DB859E
MSDAKLDPSLRKLFNDWNASVLDYRNSIPTKTKNSTETNQVRVIRVPKDFTTIMGAVEEASSGDTILVSDGTYHESISVPSTKTSLRIIAVGSEVILDGKSRLDTGFTLSANNIEVNGFSIRNFVKAGIEVAGVYGVKLIGNTISKVIEGHGIQLDQRTFSNLIWKNHVTHARLDGINLQSKNVWVVDNEFSHNGQNGVHIQTIGNHIVGNRIRNNKENGVLEDQGFNLVFNNKIEGNGKEGLSLPSGIGGSMSIGNQLDRNKRNGVHVKTIGNTLLDTYVTENSKAGVRIDSGFNVMTLNDVNRNQNNGVVLSEDAMKNLLLRNLFKGNRPEDIVVKNPNNTLLQNHIITSPFLPAEKYTSRKVGVLHVPKDFTTISDAVNAAAPGDTILVENGTYREEITIPLAKSGINIIANGDRVILDGEGKLKTALDISSNLIQIQGLKIQNYTQTGISVKGIGISLAENTIHNITNGNGIELSLAFSTLMWKNRISKAKSHGITIKAMNTWIVDNDISANGGNGINFEGSTTVGSTITHNRIQNNAQSGIADNAGFNFIYNNEMIGNRQNGVYEVAGLGSGAIIENLLYANGNGVRLDNDGAEVAGNTIRSNSKSGVLMNSDFNNLQKNTLAQNNGSGVKLTVEATGNLVSNNTIVENSPVDIKAENPNNTFLDNRCMKSDPPDICK